jgi:uncharacterized membrane protein
MSVQSKLRKTAGASLLVMGASLIAAVPSAPTQWEKCGGISKEGKNDCGSFDGKHKCAGQSTTVNNDSEWIYVPKGTCEKITGGSVLAVKSAK